MLLFAQNPPEPEVFTMPCWVASVFVPFGVAVLGCLLSFAGAWFLASRTELYRRLSRWEPYGEQLRSRQIELYGGLCQAVNDAMIPAYEYVFHSKSGEPEHNQPLSSAHRDTQKKMESLGVLVPILASSRFVAAYTAFAHLFFMFSTTDINCDTRQRERAVNGWGDLKDQYIMLQNTARTSLGIDELDEKARQAILSGFDPQ